LLLIEDYFAAANAASFLLYFVAEQIAAAVMADWLPAASEYEQCV
jgi:hypothetical protein